MHRTKKVIAVATSPTGFVSYSGLGNLASELTGKWRWQEILMDSLGKDLKEARTKLQSYTQSTQTCSEGKRATKWKLQSHFSHSVTS